MRVHQVDREIGLSVATATALCDPRAPERIRHPLRDLVAQRLYGLCCGYEDLNDHDRLRHDPLMQTAVGRADELASSPTFSRLETRATRADVMALNRVLVERFIAAQGKAPRALILDVDASDAPLHGEQELSQFHGDYDPYYPYCYLPLYVSSPLLLCCYCVFLLVCSSTSAIPAAVAFITSMSSPNTFNVRRRCVRASVQSGVNIGMGGPPSVGLNVTLTFWPIRIPFRSQSTMLVIIDTPSSRVT